MRLAALLAAISLAAISLAVAQPAAAGRLVGPLIDDVVTDRVLYPPNQPAQVDVTLHAPSEVTLTLWDGHGQQIDRQTQNADPPAARFTLHPPATDGRGYLIGVEAKDSQGVSDAASGAIDVGTDWHRFPRYGWISRFTADTDAAGLIDLLAAYRLNALQFYDVAYKAHVPAPPPNAVTWPNLSNQQVSRVVVQALLAHAHQRGMIGLLFTDWAAAYADYATDGSGARLEWGLFTRRCNRTRPCTLVDQYQFSGGPGVWHSYGWATDSLAIFDPSNPAWQNFIFRNVSAAYGQLDFDGWQIDTLGRPTGSRYAFDGSPRHMGDALVGFTNAAHQATGRRTVLNDVSRWRQDAVAAGTTTDILYSEIHPEFGDTVFYPALNGFTAEMHRYTTRPLVIAAYMDQQKAATPACRAAGPACDFGEPGIRYVDSMMLAAGAAHFELGDRNQGCPAEQAKMASNIFLPGPMLCMDPHLAHWIVDAMNFSVGYENLLRDGEIDSRQTASLAPPFAGSPLGEAGKIYLLPKTKPGLQILHLLNFTRVPTIRLDDPKGDQPPPEPLRDVVVTMHYVGYLNGRGPMWASPDVAHGAPQRIQRFSTSRDATGQTITFTLPSLEYWDMVWLETARP